MEYHLQYHSKRSEVWSWYWRAWRKSLWRVHFAIGVVLGVLLSGSKITAVHLSELVQMTGLFFLAAVLLSSLIPQILFKAQERRLDVTSDGWSTKIGTKSGSRKWAQVAAIEDLPESVIIQGANGNALVVPNRAFASEAQREAFVRSIQQWHQDGFR